MRTFTVLHSSSQTAGPRMTHVEMAPLILHEKSYSNSLQLLRFQAVFPSKFDTQSQFQSVYSPEAQLSL